MATLQELIQLAENNANLVIDAAQFSTNDLVKIAEVIKRKETHLTLLHPDKKPMIELLRILYICNTQMTLDYTR